MTVHAEGSERTRARPSTQSRLPRSADATTILAFFVALQFVLPSRLVMNSLPLSLSAASFVALGLGALWLSTQMTTTLGAAKGSSPVRTMLFAYFCVLVASYTSSAARYLDSDERELGDHVMVSTVALILVALAVCDGVRSRDRLYFLLKVIVVCGSAVALVGVLQYLFRFDPTPYMRVPGMHFSSFDSAVSDRNGLTRAVGTTANPLEFGVFCAMVFPLAVHLAFRAREMGHAVFWWTCVGFIACGLMFSVSRSPIVGLVPALIVLFVGWPARRRMWLAATTVGFLLAMQIVSPGLLHTFRSLFLNADQDSSVQARTHDYDTAQELISQHLWLGRGTGTWFAPKHEIFDNQYLLTLVESGVLGLTSFVGIFIAGAYAAVRVWRLSARRPEGVPAPLDQDLALSLLASLVVIFMTFATFDFSAFPTVSAMAFLLAGMSGALLRVVTAQVRGVRPDPYAVV